MIRIPALGDLLNLAGDNDNSGLFEPSPIPGLFDLVEKIRESKQRIRDYVRDYSIPFEKRLEVFVNTPDELMTISEEIITFRQFEAKYKSIHWYDDLDYCKGDRCDLRELVADATSHFHLETFSPEKYRAFQESVLQEGFHYVLVEW